MKRFICKFCHRHIKCFDRFKRHVTRHQRRYGLYYACGSRKKLQKSQGTISEQKYSDTISEHQSYLTNDRTDNLDKSYQCTQCGKSFRTKLRYLVKHVPLKTRVAPTPGLHTCEICDKCFAYESDLTTHSEEHQDDLIYKCPICAQCFSHCSTLFEHVKQHTLEKLHVCSKKGCQKYFIGVFALNDHMKTAHKCSLCKKEFLYEIDVTWSFKTNQTGLHFIAKRDLKQYAKTSLYDQVLYTCKGCDMHFSRLYQHQCTLCGESFAQKEQLTIHVDKTHQQSRCTTRSHCDKSYETQSGLAEQSNILKDPALPCRCTQCGKGFALKQQLLNHMKRQHTIMPKTLQFKCEHCEKSCQTRNGLRNHSNTKHPLPKSSLHQCPYCPKGFPSQRGLTSHHKFLHPTETPLPDYECEECNERFVRKLHWITHMSSSHGCKTFQCDQCKKCFAYKKTLTEHMLCHSEVKPHQCDTCGKSFKRRSVLRRHLGTHTGQKSSQCELCGIFFSSKGSLRKHMKSRKHRKLIEKDSSGS